MNLYLDDLRQPIDSVWYTKNKIYSSLPWVIVRNFNDFCTVIINHYEATKQLPEIISYDHDLADEHYDPDLFGSEVYDSVYDNFEFKTGYDCAKWLCDFCITNNIKLSNKYYIHSMNVPGGQNIDSYLQNFIKSQS